MGYISIFASIKPPIFIVLDRFGWFTPPINAFCTSFSSNILGEALHIQIQNGKMGLRIGSGAGLPKSSLSISISCLGGSSRLFLCEITFATGTIFMIFYEKTNAFQPFSEDIVGISWGNGRSCEISPT